MIDQLHVKLLKAGKLCKVQDCNQLAKVVPCTSYGKVRVPVWSDDGDECFLVGSASMKTLDYCFYHNKFGCNGGNGNGNGDG